MCSTPKIQNRCIQYYFHSELHYPNLFIYCFQQRFSFHNWEGFVDWLFRFNCALWLMSSRMIFFWILKIIIFHNCYFKITMIFSRYDSFYSIRSWGLNEFIPFSRSFCVSMKVIELKGIWSRSSDFSFCTALE